MITRSMAVERWAPRLIAAALIGSCLGVLAVAARGERSWIVWLVGPVPILALVTGWILIRLGVLSMAGS